MTTKLNLMKILYIIEEGVIHDTHLTPFESICEHIHVTTFQDAWQHYLEMKPHIVMIYLDANHHFCEEIINKIKRVDLNCMFLILAEENLRASMNKLAHLQNVKTLFGPVTREAIDLALEDLMNSTNKIYLTDDKILYEPHNSSLIYNNQRIKLTVKENKLLAYLFKNNNRIVSYDEIENYVWGDTQMNRNTLTSIVSNIRKKVNNTSLIKNYSNQGYKIINK
jgi:two-component system, OmpR family, response regulator VanR